MDGVLLVRGDSQISSRTVKSPHAEGHVKEGEHPVVSLWRYSGGIWHDDKHVCVV